MTDKPEWRKRLETWVQEYDGVDLQPPCGDYIRAAFAEIDRLSDYLDVIRVAVAEAVKRAEKAEAERDKFKEQARALREDVKFLESEAWQMGQEMSERELDD